MASVGLEYREAKPEDLPSLLELEQRIIKAERPFNPDITAGQTHYYDIRGLIDSSDSHLIVGEYGGDIVATGYAQIRQSKASLQHDIHSYLGFMFVCEEWRGQGINSQVLELLKQWSQQKGACYFYLDVYALNTAAISAYEKAGFEPCALEMKLSV